LLLFDYYRCFEGIPKFRGTETPATDIDNLRYERYTHSSGWRVWAQESWIKDFYYKLRPLLPIAIRKHIQKLYLQDWSTIGFPDWPVDRSVDILFEKLFALTMQALGTDRLPFIWFWPNGHTASAILTHDVETMDGRNFSERLMDLDDSFGIKSSFEIVPEERYTVPLAYLQTIRDRGFEINVHGLNHNGNLFYNSQTFLECAEKINRYAELFCARGFRSPSLYRNADCFQHLLFSYDMSVPNVGRLEPQRGGCCTVMPYFLPGGMTELPLTTIQDYSLFYILNDYSTTVWKQQISTILKAHGLISLLVHPDYIISPHARNIYKALLEDVGRLRSDHNVWIALPRDVDRWWRLRSAMSLVKVGENWRVEGPGSDRARVAYAWVDGDGLTYEFDSELQTTPPSLPTREVNSDALT
jgi:hypothetical protein